MKIFSFIRRQMMPLVVLCCSVFFVSQPAPAQVVLKTDPGANNPPPAGAILDLSGTPLPTGSSYGTYGTYQQYTVNFVATIPNTTITFAFREDPARVSVANISVTDVTTSSANLLVNGDFSGGTYTNNGNPRVPNSWTYSNVYGVLGGGGVFAGNVNGFVHCLPYAYCWNDGAVQAVDAISQTIPTTVGDTYQITFFVADNSGCNTGYAPIVPCNFSNISTNGDTTDQFGNGIDVTVYAQAGFPAPAVPTTYTNDGNIADFTAGITAYATFSYFNGSTCGADNTCPTSPSFTPTSAELATYGYRVYTGTLTSGLPAGNNWILATFPSAVSTIAVYPNIDHFGSPYDGFQYKIAGSNDGATWIVLFDAVTVTGAGEPFTLGAFAGTAPTSVNNVLTPQSVGLAAGCSGTATPCAIGYIAQFQFPAAYKYYAFGASTVAFAQNNSDQELSAVGGAPATQAQTTPAPPNPSGGDTTVSTVFNNNAGQHVENDVILPPNNVSTLTFPPGVDPNTLHFLSTNRIVSNANPYTIGTPFATFVPFDHAGNDTASSTGNGAKYEVVCFDQGSHTTPSEDNCPVPNPNAMPPAHIRAKDIFDFPRDNAGHFIQPPIAFGTTVAMVHWAPFGTTSTTAWLPSGTSPHPACTNVTMPVKCDLEDILVNKYGASNGFGTDTKKGDYFLGYNVPMLLSAVTVNGKSVNPTPGIQGSSPVFVRSPLTFDFLVTPALCPTCGNGWIAAPVNNLFYSFDPLPLDPAHDYPGITDLNDLTNCPSTTATPPCAVTSVTQPGASSTAKVEFTTTPANFGVGQYLLQWSAADTVKIRERNVKLLTDPSAQCPNPFPNEVPGVPDPTPPCYSTKLFNAQIVVVDAVVQQPINPDGSSVFNASRGVIPVKFTLTGTCALPPAMIALYRTSSSTPGIPIDESVYDMAADSGSNFRISGYQYIFNLAAKSLGVGTYRVDILISGSVVGSGVFALK